MYKECFEIVKHNIKRDTISRELFFKNYYVFDGIGAVYFWTLKEARSYVLLKSRQLQDMFEYSTVLFSELSAYYAKRLVEFRCYSSISQQINSYLSSCLDVLKYMTSNRKACYMMPKLRVLYGYYLNICKSLNLRVLYGTIIRKFSVLFVDYPVFCSDDFVSVKQLNINQLNKKVV